MRKSLLIAAAAVLVLSLTLVAGTGAAPRATFTASLVSDIAGFNDNGFNKNQLKGLNEAAAFKKDNATYYVKNIEGITYSTQEAGCLVGVLAAKEAQSMGTTNIGAVGGIEIPPVDSYIAGYQYCAQKVVPGTKVQVQYSNSFTDESACSSVAQNEIGSGAEVVFQVAGLCGDGALKEASKLGKWGIGVDADEYGVAKNILTSAVKKTDVGVYDVIQQVAQGTFKGDSNILLDLKNNGVGVGKISPKVPAAWITLMNSYKAKIIAGTLKPPAVVKK